MGLLRRIIIVELENKKYVILAANNGSQEMVGLDLDTRKLFWGDIDGSKHPLLGVSDLSSNYHFEELPGDSPILWFDYEILRHIIAMSDRDEIHEPLGALITFAHDDGVIATILEHYQQ